MKIMALRALISPSPCGLRPGAAHACSTNSPPVLVTAIDDRNCIVST